MLIQLQNELQSLKNPVKANLLSGYFKTGKGQYGEGDVFLGIMVPQQRMVAKKYPELSLSDIHELLEEKFHEYRLTALFILVAQYKKGDEKKKKDIAEFYLANTRRINNWDLVDLSAPNILGDYFLNKDKKILYTLVTSGNLWERRIAVLSTFMFIKYKKFDDALQIAMLLLHDQHDLIHKAVGWMLREIGKRDMETELEFLDTYRKTMPRTMLRYAIEKFPPQTRSFYLR